MLYEESSLKSSNRSEESKPVQNELVNSENVNTSEPEPAKHEQPAKHHSQARSTLIRSMQLINSFVSAAAGTAMMMISNANSSYNVASAKASATSTAEMSEHSVSTNAYQKLQDPAESCTQVVSNGRPDLPGIKDFVEDNQGDLSNQLDNDNNNNNKNDCGVVSSNKQDNFYSKNPKVNSAKANQTQTNPNSNTNKFTKSNSYNNNNSNYGSNRKHKKNSKRYVNASNSFNTSYSAPSSTKSSVIGYEYQQHRSFRAYNNGSGSAQYNHYHHVSNEPNSNYLSYANANNGNCFVKYTPRFKINGKF